MDSGKKITISVISLIVFLAIGVGISDSYVAAKMLSKHPTEKERTGFKSANPISSDIPEMFSGYMRRMQIKIKSNWEPPEQDVSKRVVVFYQIKRNGKLGSYKIIQSSNNKETDKAAIKALKKSTPFEPLPEGYTKDYVEVQFTFDYNVCKIKKK